MKRKSPLVLALPFFLAAGGCFKPTTKPEDKALSGGGGGEIYSGKLKPETPVAAEPAPAEKKIPDRKKAGDDDPLPSFLYEESAASFLVYQDPIEIPVSDVTSTMGLLREDYRKCLSAGTSLDHDNDCLDASFKACKAQPPGSVIRCQLAMRKLLEEAFPRKPNPASMAKEDMDPEQIKSLAADLRGEYRSCLKSGKKAGWKERANCLASAREQCNIRHGGSRDPASDEAAIYCKIAAGRLECEMFPELDHCKSIKD